MNGAAGVGDMAQAVPPAQAVQRTTLVERYEPSVFVQGVLWDVNSIDRWGVELGKALASRIAPALMAGKESERRHDGSTNALIRRYRAPRRAAGD